MAKLTYEKLAELISYMTDEQRQKNVTVEIFDGESMECFQADLMICGEEHDLLDEDHPVIYVTQVGEATDYPDSIEQCLKMVGLEGDTEVFSSIMIDIPQESMIGNDEGAWKNVQILYNVSKKDAVDWIKNNIGHCDGQGQIGLITLGD